MKNIIILMLSMMAMITIVSCEKEDVPRTDGPPPVAQKWTNPMGYSTVEIGPWNMDAQTAVVVPHFLIDTDKLLSVDIVIYSDTGESTALLSDGNYILEYSVGNIGLTRVNGGYFDQTAFDDPTINRGRIRFIYEL